jgi:hypothetical protein
LLILLQILGLLIAWNVVCPLFLGFGIRAYILQILCRIKEWALYPSFRWRQTIYPCSTDT